jgi:hypothetical protein
MRWGDEACTLVVQLSKLWLNFVECKQDHYGVVWSE